MELLKELCTMDGISGFEKNIAKIMQREFRKTCDSVEVDNFGNVIGRKGNGKRKIMLAAHMDEVGLMVKHINEKGFVSFVKIGGIDDRILLGKRVVIKSKKGDVQGVIGSKPPHLQKKKEREKIIRHEELFIDIGAKNEKEAKKKIEVGDPIIFEPNFGKLTDDLLYGKAIDDRIGCYTLIKIMEKIPKNIKATIYAVGTAQEEVGLKGARVSAFKLNPDYAFAIDTTIAGDTPQIKETESSLKIGKGPAITITEAGGRGVVTHPRLRELLIKTAKKYKIPYQIDVLEGGMTDGAIIYLTREGIPTGVISIPTRYIHGPTGIFSMRDLNNSVRLLTKVLVEFKV
ncbi:MAG: M42 family peptidase [Candidatus Altiarchaeales archaeon]|nr:MAG: M42 family peptidase [Candidatus Altiarchaeales archaeon]HDI72940.1 M42 family peptidase [Candidatus Altiarchaeales archaeon]